MVAERGPVVAGELSERTAPKGAWWDWDHAKLALEWLFYTGRITARRRLNDFARLYDLPERMLPASVLSAPTPSEPDARKALLAAGGAVAGRGDVAGPGGVPPPAHPASAVRWWPSWSRRGSCSRRRWRGGRSRPTSHPEASLPRRVRACALLSPFDSVIWERPRVERLFGFHYRIEIYTPAPKRRFGYYVLPFLLGDELVGRLDLKAERAMSTLLVRGAYTEPGVPDGPVAEALAGELALMAEWLGLEQVVVEGRGELAPALEAAVRLLAALRLAQRNQLPREPLHRIDIESVARWRGARTAGSTGGGGGASGGWRGPCPSGRRAAGRRPGSRPPAAPRTPGGRCPAARRGLPPG